MNREKVEKLLFLVSNEFVMNGFKKDEIIEFTNSVNKVTNKFIEVIDKMEKDINIVRNKNEQIN